MQKYRLREAMVGVSRDADGHMKIITLPAGAELDVAAATLQSGLLDARWEDQTVSVFVQDIQNRAQAVRIGAIVG